MELMQAIGIVVAIIVAIIVPIIGTVITLYALQSRAIARNRDAIDATRVELRGENNVTRSELGGGIDRNRDAIEKNRDAIERNGHAIGKIEGYILGKEQGRFTNEQSQRDGKRTTKKTARMHTPVAR